MTNNNYDIFKVDIFAIRSNLSFSNLINNSLGSIFHVYICLYTVTVCFKHCHHELVTRSEREVELRCAGTVHAEATEDVGRRRGGVRDIPRVKVLLSNLPALRIPRLSLGSYVQTADR